MTTDLDRPAVTVLHGPDLPPRMGPVERIAHVRYASEGALRESLPGTEVLFVWDFRSRALAPAWRYTDRLRWVHIASAGVDPLLFPELITSDVLVTNSRGIFDEPMVEYVLGLILCFAKDLHTTLRLQREKQWRHRETERMSGSRVLVVGTGPIGRAIGRRLAASGMVVSGLGRTERPDDPDLGRVRAAGHLYDALAEADYVVLAAPLTDTTRGMIDASALNQMRPNARLINVGRGELVVQDDLVAALEAHRIAGAALDVFTDEPLPESSPLWEMPHVVVSPHMSGDVVGWREALVDLFLDNLLQYRRGRPLLNVVDKHRGYVPTEPRDTVRESR